MSDVTDFDRYAWEPEEITVEPPDDEEDEVRKTK